MIIVGYDGSEDAQAAVDQAVRLFRDKPATVLTVWEPYGDLFQPRGVGLGSGFVFMGFDRTEGIVDLNAQLHERARQTAEEGAQRLRAAGLGAESLVEKRNGSVAKTVLAVAERINAEAIVIGTRGRGEAKSMLLGSVSHELVQHADRAVVVAPSAALARHRES